MKRNAVFQVIFSLIAIALFITGIVLFSFEEGTVYGSTAVSSGFIFLFLGIYFSRKDRKS